MVPASVMASSADGLVNECFSETYMEARAKFLEASRTASAEVHSLEITKDAEGSYTTDIAIVRGSGSGLVVVSSGTHGVEGYAGSAVQLHVLDTLKRAPVKPTVVLIHAVNPFGMAHYRRWNENNVDLNRNALHDADNFAQLIEKDKLRDTYYKFDGMFNPRRPPGCFYVHVGIWFHMAFQIARYGLKALKTALVAATYTQSQGLFFGGQELQPSHALLRAFMQKHFGHVRASNVAWLDVHTGLGPCGIDVLMGAAEDAAEMAQICPVVPGECAGFQTGFGRSTEETIALRCGSPDTGGLVVESRGKVDQSAGYDFTVGIMGRDEWTRELFMPSSGRTLSMTQEFGTLSNIKVARALMLENVGFHHDRINHEYWRSFSRDAFYVRTRDWKRRVLKRGMDVFEKLVSRAEAVAGMN
mmetsp:Transcript_18562/g.36420  ORF Transcript_18562/g.36420 Transcript_18562/m.36420 type:complete len:415 (+) Transcript_18562:84-1328(+)